MSINCKPYILINYAKQLCRELGFHPRIWTTDDSITIVALMWTDSSKKYFFQISYPWEIILDQHENGMKEIIKNEIACQSQSVYSLIITNLLSKG